MATIIVNMEEYKTIVLGYINRLIDEKAMEVNMYKKNGRPYFTIQFVEPQWYMDLDENLKNYVFTNLQNHYKALMKKFIAEFNTDRRASHQTQVNLNETLADAGETEDRMGTEVVGNIDNGSSLAFAASEKAGGSMAAWEEIAVAMEEEERQRE